MCNDLGPDLALLTEGAEVFPWNPSKWHKLDSTGALAFSLFSWPYPNCLNSLRWLATSISVTQRWLWRSHFCDKRLMWSKKSAVSPGDSGRRCFIVKPLRSLTVKKPAKTQISYISNGTVFLSYQTSVHGIIISMVSVSLHRTILCSRSPSAAFVHLCETPPPVLYLEGKHSQAQDRDTQLRPPERWKEDKLCWQVFCFSQVFLNVCAISDKSRISPQILPMLEIECKSPKLFLYFRLEREIYCDKMTKKGFCWFFFWRWGRFAAVETPPLDVVKWKRKL